MARHKKKTPGASNWEKLRKTIAKPTRSKTKPKKDPVQSPPPSLLSEVTEELRKRKSKPLLFSSPTTISTDITHRLAMDCEMVGVGKEGKESELAKVSIVNVYGDVVYNKYVIPRSHVTDYRAHITGLTGKILKEEGVRFKVAQAEVAEMIKDRIVIGHGLSNDFAVLEFSHSRHLIRDTSSYKPFKEISRGNTPSLKNLVKHFLGSEVQTGVHDSVEDARSALLLYRKHRAAWERSMKQKKKRAKMGEGEDGEEEDGLED